MKLNSSSGRFSSTGDCSLATIFSFSPADVLHANVIPGHDSHPADVRRRHGSLGWSPPLSKLPSLYHSACGTLVKKSCIDTHQPPAYSSRQSSWEEPGTDRSPTHQVAHHVVA